MKMIGNHSTHHDLIHSRDGQICALNLNLLVSTNATTVAHLVYPSAELNEEGGYCAHQVFNVEKQDHSEENASQNISF
jgi:hypothetical protein